MMSYLCAVARADSSAGAIIFGIIAVLWLLGKVAGSTERSSGGGIASRGSLDIRVERNQEKEANGWTLYTVGMKSTGGLHPGSPGFITVVTSLIDVTDGESPGESLPVYSLVDEVQEPSSFAFKSVQGPTPVGNSFTMSGYATVSIFSPDILICPKPGRRKVRVIVRMFANLDSHAGISNGRFHGTCLATGATEWWMEETSPGYLEQHRRQADALEVAVWVGMAVAAADGRVGEDELGVIKDWLKSQLDRSVDQDVPRLRERIHSSMRAAFAAAQCGEIGEDAVASRLRALADEDLQVRAITLGYNVLAADGEADPGELAILESLARKAGVDRAVLARIKDTTLVGVATIGGDDLEDLPGLLGFDPEDDPTTIRKHLRNEHRKWNARSANAKTKEDRERVELMLDCIARALREYAS